MKDNQILLREYYSFTPTESSLIKESTAPNGNLIVTGKIQAANTLNRNGRIYPRDILEREITKYQQKINERTAVGELDHPDRENINYSNVALHINKIWWEGDDVWADVEVLPTTLGKIARVLFESKIRVGISSRAVGSVTQITPEQVRVNDDLELICWDFVHNESTIGAYLAIKTIKESTNLNEAKITELSNYGQTCKSKTECLLYDIFSDLNSE